MEVKKTLGRYVFTRRITGRRAITPIQSKHRKIKKTRGHKVERRPYVSILKHTIPYIHGEREETDESQLGDDSKRQGHQDSCDKGKGENTEEHTQVEQVRDTENSEKSVHPGPVQTVHHMSEPAPATLESQTACDTETEETHIEAELLQ